MWNQVSLFYMIFSPLNSSTPLFSILCSLSFSFVSLMRRHHLSSGVIPQQLVVLATVSMVTSHCLGLLMLRFILGSLGNVIRSHCVLISSHPQFASVEGCTSVCLKVFSRWLTDKDVWRLSAMFAQSCLDLQQFNLWIKYSNCLPTVCCRNTVLLSLCKVLGNYTLKTWYQHSANLMSFKRSRNNNDDNSFFRCKVMFQKLVIYFNVTLLLIKSWQGKK